MKTKQNQLNRDAAQTILSAAFPTRPLRKVRPDDVLGNLPAAEQDRILDMLDHRSYRDVLEEINCPAPEGLGLSIQYNSLRRFYLKHLPKRLALEHPDEAADWQVLVQQAALQPIELGQLIREALEREVFLALRDADPADPRPLKLLQCLLRWRSQDLANAKRSKRSVLPDLDAEPAPVPAPIQPVPTPGPIPTSEPQCSSVEQANGPSTQDTNTGAAPDNSDSDSQDTAPLDLSAILEILASGPGKKSGFPPTPAKSTAPALLGCA